MKVLKSYTSKESEIVVCPICNSVLEANRDDIYTKIIEDKAIHRFIDCPVCRVSIDIETV